jgi:hypothetical protein
MRFFHAGNFTMSKKVERERKTMEKAMERDCKQYRRLLSFYHAKELGGNLLKLIQEVKSYARKH